MTEKRGSGLGGSRKGEYWAVGVMRIRRSDGTSWSLERDLGHLIRMPKGHKHSKI
jgi:hypothetical protein